MKKATVVFKRICPILSPNPQSLHPKTSCRFLRFRRQKPTFPFRKTYGSAPGNVRFPTGKHRKRKDIFPIIYQCLNKKGRKFLPLPAFSISLSETNLIHLHLKPPFSGREPQLPFTFRLAVHTPATKFGRELYLRGGSFRHPEIHGSAVSRLVHFQHNAAATRQGDLRTDEIQVCRMRSHPKSPKGRFHSFYAGNVLRKDGQRTAAPRMVVGTASETFTADAPAFPQGGQRAFNHGAITQLHAVQGVLIIAHCTEGLQHVFLHVRTGVIPLGKERTDDRIQFFGQDTRHDSQRLCTVVGLSMIIRRNVILAIPERAVEYFPQAVGSGVCLGGFFRIASQPVHLFVSLQGNHVPEIEQQRHVLVLSPVTPCPSAGTRYDQSQGIRFPHMNVFLSRGSTSRIV